MSAEQDLHGRFAEDCPFCAIAHGRDPNARIVASAPAWVAFFPPQPATPGHTLVIPRVHFPDFWAADEATVATVSRAAFDVGRGIQRALGPDGLNLITSAGGAAEQTVLHFHVHLVPRWEDDAFGKIWPPKGLVAQADVDAAFERVRRELPT